MKTNLSLVLLCFCSVVALGANAVAKRFQTPVPLSAAEIVLGKAAWRYFERNRLPNGLVASTEGYPLTTMWDVGSTLAGLASAHELGLIAPKDFHAWMGELLSTLGRLPLYRGELPNKAYNANTLVPVDYGKPDEKKEVGFSALDLGRLARWLNLVARLYPEHSTAVFAVSARWKIARLTKDGVLMGSSVKKRKELWAQEGRHGYEQYSAYGVEKLGINVSKSLDDVSFRTYVDVEGVQIPVDKRTTYHNYVTSEPYLLDGLESGFSALSVEDASRVLGVQEIRYRKTKIPTAWSEDNLDKFPWFTYNCIYVDGYPWRTISFGGDDVTALRGSSTKAAVAWNALFRNSYSSLIYKHFGKLYDSTRGVYGGYFEASKETNRVLSVNTNGVVLEALFYQFAGHSFEEHIRLRKSAAK